MSHLYVVATREWSASHLATALGDAVGDNTESGDCPEEYRLRELGFGWVTMLADDDVDIVRGWITSLLPLDLAVWPAGDAEAFRGELAYMGESDAGDAPADEDHCAACGRELEWRTPYDDPGPLCPECRAHARVGWQERLDDDDR